MKKFFKILLKIIKILLKIIIHLIFWIIVITWIFLFIINNKTLKFYENENFDTIFNTDKYFNVEYWTEITFNLSEWNVLYKDIYSGWRIDTIEWSNIKRKNLSSDIIVKEDWNIKHNMFVKIKLPKFSLIKEFYKNWNIQNFGDFLWYSLNINFIDYFDNWQISEKWQLINWLENWYFINYYQNWQIKEEWYYIDWVSNWTFTWYYENWNIEYINNFKNWKLDWYSIIYHEDWSYISVEANDWIWIKTIYDKNDNIINKYSFFTNEQNNIIQNLIY